ncbi:MAG: HAMP domain-containing sensor histidine kinase [bacterium]|nr:HAMP domain-containing sensor histidine kinase [bacterium]
MKNDMSRRFHTRVMSSILYSAVITCLVEIFLITNIDMITRYMGTTNYSTSAVYGILSSNNFMTMLYVLLGMGIFSLSFLAMQKSFLDYIGKISETMQNISEGDFNTEVEVRGDDEFSSMAVSLNRMAQDLKELMIKEREAERTKNELITNVAHDLRTPLTSIIGYLELLSQKPDLPQELRCKYIDIAYSKSRRLEKLIEDLFGFTKLNYGKISMKISEVDIVKLLEQLLEEFYPSFAEKNLYYELQTNVSSKNITADGDLMARLFDNLINNAIKYGAEGKRILVKVKAEEEWVSISVINYGYVIPEEDLPLLFNKFYRVEQSRSVSTGGTGLGLAIAKSIVDMHGGTIEVSSDLSNGTVFTVRLRVHFDLNKENFGKIG